MTPRHVLGLLVGVACLLPMNVSAQVKYTVYGGLAAAPLSVSGLADIHASDHAPDRCMLHAKRTIVHGLWPWVPPRNACMY